MTGVHLTYAGSASAPLSLNGYAYANGDPTQLSDPSEHDSFDPDQLLFGGKITETGNTIHDLWYGYGPQSSIEQHPNDPLIGAVDWVYGFSHMAQNVRIASDPHASFTQQAVAAFNVVLTAALDVAMVGGLVEHVGAEIGERLLDGELASFGEQVARDGAIDIGDQVAKDATHAPAGDLGSDVGKTAVDEPGSVGAAGCGAGLSFAADTQVATPSGERVIGSLKVGDTVEAYNPTTGHAEPQTVQHVWLNRDHDLVDVTVRTEPPQSAADDTARAQRAAVKAHGSQAPPADETIHTAAHHAHAGRRLTPLPRRCARRPPARRAGWHATPAPRRRPAPASRRR